MNDQHSQELLSAAKWARQILHDYWFAQTVEEKNHYAADIPSAMQSLSDAIERAEGRDLTVNLYPKGNE